jgi:superfamily II DNA or RNA helicase
VAVMITPRPYQVEAVDAAFGAWGRGMMRPAEVLFTGAGKTVIFAGVGTRWIELRPADRVLVVVHTEELLDQAIARWKSVAPGIRVGAVQAQRNETLARVIVATVQTLRSESRRAMLRNVGLVIVDECHHAVATTYRTVMNWFGCFGGENRSGGESARAIGYTATMMRADQLALGDVWQDVVYSRTIADGIADGSLVRPRGIHVQVDDLDLSRVRMSGGDYRQGDLGEAIESSLAPAAVAKAVAEHAAERKIMVFAPTVGSARAIGDALSASGRRVGLVHGELPKLERRAVLDAFRADPRGILTNCQVLTEGFDEPAADCAVIARPTRSPGLYIQIAGRVLRPFPGKTDALLLDVVGATKMHSLVSGIELFGEAPKEREPAEGWEDPDELADGQQDARTVLGKVVDGPLVSTEVDLFAGSSMQWHRTRAGVFFLEAGERYIAIVPAQGGGYDVTQMHRTQRHTGKWIIQGVPDLSYAMAWADGDVTSSERTTAAKGRSWRAQAPSEKLKALATRLRIPFTETMRMGEVSNMVTIALASNRIDPYLPSYMRGAR